MTTKANDQSEKQNEETRDLRSGSRRLVFFAMSLFIIYHLVVVILLPNDHSVTARSLSRFLTPYANEFAFNTPWQFFSPGPAPTFYLEYEVNTKDGGDEALVSDPKIWPPPKKHRGFDDRFLRSLYTTRYFALSRDRFEQYFMPWMCRQHPEAESIAIRMVLEEVPGMERASWVGENFDAMANRVAQEKQYFQCKTETSPDDFIIDDSESP